MVKTPVRRARELEDENLEFAGLGLANNKGNNGRKWKCAVKDGTGNEVSESWAAQQGRAAVDVAAMFDSVPEVKLVFNRKKSQLLNTNGL
nr:hypothetical protein Iba_chr12aCG10940 [Ipomoea batatas]